MKVPRSTLYDNLIKLYLEGKVGKRVSKRRKRGRPTVYWYIIERAKS